MKATIKNVVRIIKTDYCIIITEHKLNSPILSEHKVLLRELASIKVYKDKLNRKSVVITFK